MNSKIILFIAIFISLSSEIVAQETVFAKNLNGIFYADTLKKNNQINFFIDQIGKRINSNNTPKLNIEYYNMAICFSAKNQIDSTCFYLFKSITESPNFNDLVLTDTDFNFLHQTSCWIKITQHIDSIYLSQFPGITNKELAIELYHILLKDQHIRGLGLKKIDRSPINVDSLNLKRVEEIIQQYGWPTFSMVGKKSAEGAFIVIQHSNTKVQMKYFKQILDAARKGEVNRESIALLMDRINVNLKGWQIYGTQVYRTKDSITGQPGKYKYFPIKNEEKVDSVRKVMGLMPIKQYYALFGIDYTPVAK